MLTWSLGTHRLGQQFPNHPVPGGILGALLSTTSLMTQWLRAPGVQVAHKVVSMSFYPRSSRREALSESLRGQEPVPPGYFRLVIAGCGFYSSQLFDSNVVWWWEQPRVRKGWEVALGSGSFAVVRATGKVNGYVPPWHQTEWCCSELLLLGLPGPTHPITAFFLSIATSQLRLLVHLKLD